MPPSTLGTSLNLDSPTRSDTAEPPKRYICYAAVRPALYLRKSRTRRKLSGDRASYRINFAERPGTGKISADCVDEPHCSRPDKPTVGGVVDTSTLGFTCNRRLTPLTATRQHPTFLCTRDWLDVRPENRRQAEVESICIPHVITCSRSVIVLSIKSIVNIYCSDIRFEIIPCHIDLYASANA